LQWPETKTVTNSPISLSFRYSEIDYVRAFCAHYADRLRLWLDVCVVVALGAVGIYLWPSLIFRREPKFRDEYSLTFSSEGIHFQTAHIDSHLAWDLYSRALVDAHSYVLYYGSRTFTVIPKRVFQNNQQQEAFDQLLAGHVPKIVRKK
jgi:hypothetical protein